MPKEINFKIVKNGWKFYRLPVTGFLHLGIFVGRTVVSWLSKCWLSNIFLQKKNNHFFWENPWVIRIQLLISNENRQCHRCKSLFSMFSCPIIHRQSCTLTKEKRKKTRWIEEKVWSTAGIHPGSVRHLLETELNEIGPSRNLLLVLITKLQGSNICN